MLGGPGHRPSIVPVSIILFNATAGQDTLLAHHGKASPLRFRFKKQDLQDHGRVVTYILVLLSTSAIVAFQSLGH